MASKGIEEIWSPHCINYVDVCPELPNKAASHCALMEVIMGWYEKKTTIYLYIDTTAQVPNDPHPHLESKA